MIQVVHNRVLGILDGMLMIPVPYALAALLGLLLLRELGRRDEANRSPFFLGFLLVQIFQLIVIGTRFGYGYDELLLIQPFTASLIPPLAYLSFKNPTLNTTHSYRRLWIHTLPFILTILTSTFAIELMDATLGLCTLFYAAALLLMGLKGHTALPWVTLGRGDYVLRLLWLSVGFLIISGITDVIVAIDFWLTGGSNTGSIAGIATLSSLVVFGLLGLAYYGLQQYQKYQQNTATTSSDKEVNEAATTLLQIKTYLDSKPLYLDPDLNLTKLARKVGIPPRQVSSAINQQTGLSVSQFINELRINIASRLLVETEQTVTKIMLESGFNTKSNFNREFKHKTGMSPSQWRKTNKPTVK